MTLNIRSRIEKLPKWLSFVILEGWPIIVIMLALTVEFRHILNTSWLQQFLYNGDSLTLPVMRNAFAQKEHFLWVSSSQFLLFPEGLFYLVSSIVAKSIRASLVFNGYLNIVVLYVLFRLTAGTMAKTRLYLKQLYAIGCTLLLIFYMLLEQQALINGSSVATLFIFNSYYFGVIVAGGFLLYISLKQIKATSGSRRLSNIQITLSILALLIAGLASFSNPIFIIQFTIPLLVALVVVYIFNGLRLKEILVVAMPILSGSLIGYVARTPFKAFVGVPLGSHVVTGQIPGTLAVFHQAISTDLKSKAGTLELFLVLAVISFSAVYVGWWLHQKTLVSKRNLDGSLLLLSLFAIVCVLVITFFSIAIGSMVTRYMLPAFIFPLFGLLPILSYRPPGILRSVLLSVSVLIISVTVVAGTLSISSVNSILSDPSYNVAKCLQKALNNKPAYGIGSYWTVRTLNIYGQKNEQALQVYKNLYPFVWQTNLGSYKNKKLSFIVVEKQPSVDSRSVSVVDPYVPANPSAIYSCGDVYVYLYQPGTEGYKLLNNNTEAIYNKLVEARSNGTILNSY